jgi:hypothetical protein
MGSVKISIRKKHLAAAQQQAFQAVIHLRKSNPTEAKYRTMF